MKRCFVWNQARSSQAQSSNKLDCVLCHRSIHDGDIIAITEYELKGLYKFAGDDEYKGYYHPQSLRCLQCHILERIQHAASGLAGSTPSDDPYQHQAEYNKMKGPLEEIMRQVASAVIPGLVRDELKKILREEAADPHGAFSPD